MEPASGSRFRISEGDWICSDPQYATHCGFAYLHILNCIDRNRRLNFTQVIVSLISYIPNLT